MDEHRERGGKPRQGAAAREDVTMQIAIHPQGLFSERWLDYCREHGIPCKVVNCYACDILEQLRSVDILLWHWGQYAVQNYLVAGHLIRAAEMMGVRVFPSTATCWHFDDKVAQKYLLEAVGAPLVPTYVFYSLADALEWIDHASFPKVSKLRRGAGSQNVWLVRSARDARALARRAFGKGFRVMPTYLQDARARFRKGRRRQGALWAALKRLPKTVMRIVRVNRELGRERGYLYFQDFMADNAFDTRVTAIGGRAFGFTRDVRPGDFRASGSGSICYDLDRVNLKCVRIALDVARKVGSQSMAVDFVTDEHGEPLITEVSYGYVDTAVHECPGHWDEDLTWHEGHVWPQDAIIEDLLAAVR